MLTKFVAFFRRPGVRRIAGNTGWLLGEKMLRLCLGVLVNIWVARALGPTGFGLLNYAIAFALLFRGLASGGLEGVVTRELVANRKDAGAIMGTVFFLRAITGWGAFGLTLLACTTLQTESPPAFDTVAICAIGTLFLAFDVIDFWFQSRTASKWVVIARGAAFVVAQCATLVLVLRQANILAIAIAQASELVLAAFALALTYRLTGGRFTEWQVRAPLAWTFLRKSWPLLLSGMGVIIYMKTAQIVLGHLKGSAEVGIYSVAARLAEAWYFLPALVASSVFPKLVESYQVDQRLYFARLQHLLNLVFWVALAIAVPMSLFSPKLIEFLYGVEFAGAAPMLSIHIWGCCFIFMGTILSKTLIIEGELIFSLVRHLCGAAVNVGLNFLLIPRYGGVGAAIATVVSYATAAYFASFLYEPTRRSGRQMTVALLQPVLLPLALLRNWLAPVSSPWPQPRPEL